jgi:hypothetical protein
VFVAYCRRWLRIVYWTRNRRIVKQIPMSIISPKDINVGLSDSADAVTTQSFHEGSVLEVWWNRGLIRSEYCVGWILVGAENVWGLELNIDVNEDYMGTDNREKECIWVGI